MSDSTSGIIITITTKDGSDGCVHYSSASSRREVSAQIEPALAMVEPPQESVPVTIQDILCVYRFTRGE